MSQNSFSKVSNTTCKLIFEDINKHIIRVKNNVLDYYLLNLLTIFEWK